MTWGEPGSPHEPPRGSEAPPAVWLRRAKPAFAGGTRRATAADTCGCGPVAPELEPTVASHGRVSGRLATVLGGTGFPPRLFPPCRDSAVRLRPVPYRALSGDGLDCALEQLAEPTKPRALGPELEQLLLRLEPEIHACRELEGE